MSSLVTVYNKIDYNNGYACILKRSIIGIKIENEVKFRIHYVSKPSWEPITSSSVGDLKAKKIGIKISGKSYKVYASGF